MPRNREIFDREQCTILDGGMGTLLQRAGLQPGQVPEEFTLNQGDKLIEIHKAYLDAGAQILTTNTFGTNGKKLAGTGISVEQSVCAAVECARKAAQGRAKVALDVGPLGEMMEPNGMLSFEDAYNLFAQVVKAGAEQGVDYILIETMADLYETKAAALAAVECCDLPVLVSMTFEEGGRSFAGVPVEAFAATIGGLGVSALGINCSLGPVEVAPIVERLCRATSLPVFAMPNAGLPDPLTGEHKMDALSFAQAVVPYAEMGVQAIGGCCGTTPETIAQVCRLLQGQKPARRPAQVLHRLCGSTKVVDVIGPVAIGERINPAGKKKLQQALQAGDLSYVQTLAVEQEQAGAKILDVNVGAVGVDEVDMLPRAVKAVQAVSGLPLQLDSANPQALAAALRVCCGKPIVNSTSGEMEKMQQVLPLCQKYGAAVVGLTLDEEGIPDGAEQRFAIARRILEHALEYGMQKEDVYIDCLTLSVGAQPDAGLETLKALSRVRGELGLLTVLGVSNVSFGLPDRPLVNRTFLTMALQAGLDLPILNPMDGGMMSALDGFRLLAGYDVNAEQYVKNHSEAQAAPVVTEVLSLGHAIEKGLKQEAAQAARQLVQQPGAESLQIVNEHLIPALDRVGKGFEEKTLFLPQLLAAAGAAQSAFEVIREAMGAEADKTGPPIVVATVQGDVHDIGKNIAKVLLENYGFHVIDLGRDVPPERVVQTVLDSGASMVGLSALMTTTLPSMARTVEAVKACKPDCKILVGGAVLTEEYARSIGADFYAKDAKSSADYARSVQG